MATHAEIITRSGKDDVLADLLGVKFHQVRDWRLRNSIPAERWKGFVEHGYATWEELGAAAASKVRDEARPAA